MSGFQLQIAGVISGSGNVKKETREEIEKLLVEYIYRTSAVDLRKKKGGYLCGCGSETGLFEYH